MVQVRRRERESIGSLLRRFARKVQQSGVLINARRVRFYEKTKSRKRRREEALRRVQIRAIKEKLVKLGKFDEEMFETKKQKLLKQFLEERKK